VYSSTILLNIKTTPLSLSPPPSGSCIHVDLITLD
jgi:hypothetical protein